MNTTRPHSAVSILGGLLLATLGVAPSLAQVASPTAPLNDPQPELKWRQHTWLQGAIGIVYDPVRQVVVAFGNGHFGNEKFSFYEETWEWDGKSWSKRWPVHHPPGRYGAALAYDPVRKTVLLFGGYTDPDNRRYFDDTWEWDGSDWTRLQPRSSPPARYFHAMETDHARGEIVLYGGLPPGSSASLSDTWVWDGRDWSQRTPKTQPVPRCSLALCFNPLTQRVAMFGGYRDQPFWRADDEVYEWDGTDWVHLPQSIKPPRSTASVFVFDPTLNKLLLTAGSYRDQTWTWDGKVWARLHPKTVLPFGKGATDVARNQVVVFGHDDTSIRGEGAETWTFAQGDWQRIHVYTDMPTVLSAGSDMAHDEVRDELVCLGLEVEHGTGPPRYDFQMWVVRDDRAVRLHPKTMPPIRATGSYDLIFHEGEGKVLLFGGHDLNHHQLNDIWVWDGRDWAEHPLSKASGPQKTYFLYDRKRGEVVAIPYDGFQWTWDFHTGWSSKAIQVVPPKFYIGRVGRPVYDRLRDRVVLYSFFHVSPSGYAGQVWEWDGVAWSQSPVTPPPKLGSAGFSDAVGGILYMPSGVPQTGTFVYDEYCWVYNGRSWRRLPLSIEPGRVGGRVAGGWPLHYDANRRRLRAIGGGNFIGSDFARHNLLPVAPHPRPGEAAVLDVTWPGKAGQPFWWALSTSTWPGIPLLHDAQLGNQVLPLGPSPLLDATAPLGLVSVLDGQGKGRIRIPVPNLQSLVGIPIFAAGVLLGQNGIEAISNRVQVEVVR